MSLKYEAAGIGYFTLLAAAMGARVVASEPTDFNYFTEMCSGSEAGSFHRLLYHSAYRMHLKVISPEKLEQVVSSRGERPQGSGTSRCWLRRWARGWSLSSPPTSTSAI